MAIAKIIVDVPLMQTDQPYSYKIPEEFEGMLEVGMRVHVPFGKANRLIQGIVLGMESQSDADVADEDLKEIAEVLDFSPVLTEEQFWLADQLRKIGLLPTRSPSLKAMLPEMFKILPMTKFSIRQNCLSSRGSRRPFVWNSDQSLAFSSLDIDAASTR